jgi:hypothetical protein
MNEIINPSCDIDVVERPPIHNDQEFKCDCVPRFNLFVPFDFHFCRNFNLSIPVIAMPYCQMHVNLEELAPFENSGG